MNINFDDRMEERLPEWARETYGVTFPEPDDEDDYDNFWDDEEE